MKPLIDLKGSAVLVTGASSGIGAATAQLLSELGVSLVLSGRNLDRLNSVYESLDRCEGSKHAIVSADLAKQGEGGRLINEAVAQIGPLSGMVHCAGVRSVEPIRFFKEATFDETINANVRSAFSLLAAFRKPSNRRVGASAVLVGSVVAHKGQPGVSAYCASKGALIAASRSWARELSREGLRVNVISPGYVEGPMLEAFKAQTSTSQQQELIDSYPLGLGRPIDVANGIAFLLSSASQWITGISLPVDGGFLS